MSMSDKNGINRFEGSFGNVVDLSAIYQNAGIKRFDANDQEWVIQQTGKKSRLEKAEGIWRFHLLSIKLMTKVVL